MMSQQTSEVGQTNGEEKCVLGRGNIKKGLGGRERENGLSGSWNYAMFNFDVVFGEGGKNLKARR